MQKTSDHSPVEPVATTPPWAFTGAFAGLAIATGATALTYSLCVGAATPTLVSISQDGLGIGGLLLGLAWLRALKQRHGGFGAMAGSFAIPLALLYAKHSQDDLALVQVNALIVVAAFAWFAIGHALVRGVPVARAGAIIAALCFLLLIVATAAHATLAAAGPMLSIVGVGGIAFTGIALAFEMPRLKTSRWSL